MINSILIGKALKSILSGYSIKPLVVKEGAKFPFITYRRNGVSPTYTKDGIVEDEVSLSITVYSDKYDESIEIANQVRSKLECKQYTDEDLRIVDCKITSISEGFASDSYYQQLDFRIITQ